ncbi:MAG TPA: GNAT family N-acetyltransferase [Phycisphaerales bacterium]|nr:GNAT family N-acetyltransferase [Phycisphaerales bacterium]
MTDNIHARDAAPAPGASKPGPADVEVRLLRPDDPIPAITKLLHRAYAQQVAMGLRPLAGRQDDETTRRRCTSGECYLAVLKPPFRSAAPLTEGIVGTILFHEVEADQGPPWFQKPFVDSFSQFAVDPDLQGLGLGRSMLEIVERRAREQSAQELALSMAEPDENLRRFYEKRGYRYIEHWKWPYTNYTSLILSKTLG